MQFRVFSVSVGDPSGCDDLNRFLAGHRVLTVQREFIQNGRESGWAFCVEYLGTTGGSGGSGTGFRKERVDYKAVLPGCYHSLAKRLRGKGRYFLQKRMHRAEGDYFDDSAMCGGGL